MSNAGFCVHCGKHYEAGVSFCPGCGHKLAGNTAAGADASFPSQAGQMPQGGMPSYPPPPIPKQPFISQPFQQQPYPAQPTMQPPPRPVSAGKKGGLPAWSIALLILVPVAIVLVLLWQPLLAMFNGRSGGGAAQASGDPTGQSTVAASLPASSVAADDSSDKSVSTKHLNDTVGSGDDVDDSSQNRTELIPPLFSQAELTGFYEFFVEVTETTEKGSPVKDQDNPVGAMKNMFVFLSMEDDNKAVVHFHRKHEAEGEPSLMVADINGDKVDFYDFSKGTEEVRKYQGRLMDDQDKVVLEGTFEQMALDAEDSSRVIRGKWRMISMSDSVFEGVDLTRAEKDLDVTEPSDSFTGTLTYTDLINLDNVDFLDESGKRRLKDLQHVPMNTTLTFVGDRLELVIQDPEGETTILEDFWPIEVYEGHVFTRTFEEVRNPRYLGGVLYRDGDQLRFEGRYSHLMFGEGEFVYLLMRIEAVKPFP